MNATSTAPNAETARIGTRAISTWAAVGGTGFGVGPVAGGLLLSTAGWSVVFWVNVPVGLLVLAGATVTVPRSRRSEHPLDRLGARDAEPLSREAYEEVRAAGR